MTKRQLIEHLESLDVPDDTPIIVRVGYDSEELAADEVILTEWHDNDDHGKKKEALLIL